MLAPTLALENKPYPVRRVVTHFEVHEDELNAYEQACMLAPERFPGISTAPIMLVDAGLHVEDGRDGDWLLANKGQICFGVYGGTWDEHGADKAVRKHHSASTRMGDWLGRRDDPGLAPLLTHSLRVDRHAGSTPFELANLIKSWWGAGVKLPDVVALYRLAFRSLYRKFSGAPPLADVQPGMFRWLIAEFFVEAFAPEDQKRKLLGTFKTGEDAAVFFNRVADEVQPITSLDCRTSGKTDFDLESIWEAMVMAGVPLQERRRFVLTSLKSKYVEQLDFLSARREFHDKLADGRACYLEPKRSVYRVAVVSSDSRLMNRAVKYDDTECDVLVQLRSDGSAQVRDLYQRLNLNPVVAQLRISELPKIGIKRRIPMADLLSDGTLPLVPSWFNWEEGHGVFNRTNTARYTPVTKLSPEEVVGCVASGLWVAHRDHRVESARALHARLKQKREARQEADLASMVDAIVLQTFGTGVEAVVQS